MITLKEALEFVGVDSKNANRKLKSARAAAIRWLDSAEPPQKLRRFMVQFVNATTDIEVPVNDLVVLVGAALYVAMPIDLIPDVIPFVGWTDDMAVVSAALHTIGIHWAKHEPALAEA